jgi:hypothetical protein
MNFRLIAIAAWFVLVSHGALAKEMSAHAVNAADKDSFATVSEWVRKQMTPGGRYAEVNGEELQTVNARLDEMGRLFEQRTNVDGMNAEEKKKLLVDQEEINSILGKRDGERLICRNERPIGSNIPVKTCVTAREMEDRRREDRKGLDRLQIGVQKKGGS